jgi:predicted NAD/FAD-dependent oxidoreductase
MTKKKLLLLGAGPTSSLIAYNIKTSPRLQDAFDIRIWEKSTRVGGRFSTSRSRTNPNCYADLGAQYLTYSGNAFSRPYFNSTYL